MFEYYKVLEERDNFKVYLKRGNLDRKRYSCVSNVELGTDFYLKYSDLFRRLKYIDGIFAIDNSKSLEEYFYETGEFLIPPTEDENYEYIESLKKKVTLSIWDAIDILKFYLEHLTYYKVVFPDMKEFIEETLILLKMALKDLGSLIKLELPELDSGFVYTPPNAWFITPNGYLYNTGGKEGHKEGNLIYAYSDICQIMGTGVEFVRLNKVNDNSNGLENSIEKKNMLSINEKIRKILECGYVDCYEFLNYANLMFQFGQEVTIDGPKYVSYQRNVITLVVGYLAALDSFYKAYGRLGTCKNAKNLICKVAELANGDMVDILVRFAGFSKIESQRDKTITTSALNGIELFKKYLDRGWTLDIIPGIVYDKYKEEVSPVNMDSLFVQRYLDEKLSEYKGKGKVLIHSLH